LKVVFSFEGNVPLKSVLIEIPYVVFFEMRIIPQNSLNFSFGRDRYQSDFKFTALLPVE
jgi:hypothetical protein